MINANSIIELYTKEITDLKNTCALQLREKFVIPFCDKWNIKFMSGNGTYLFVYNDDPEKDIQSYPVCRIFPDSLSLPIIKELKLPKTFFKDFDLVLDAIDRSIDGEHDSYWFMYMDDYIPNKE